MAVIESADITNTPERIKKIIRESLGDDYALDEVYSLGELGLRSFPVGPTGKILNLKLKEAILEVKERRDSIATPIVG